MTTNIKNVIVNVTTALAGGDSADILTATAPAEIEIVGGYIALTTGASRNWQVQVRRSGANSPVSDNDASTKSFSPSIYLEVGDSIRITGAAAADQATYTGVLSYKELN